MGDPEERRYSMWEWWDIQKSKRQVKPVYEANNEFGFSYTELMMTRGKEQGAEVVGVLPWRKAKTEDSGII